MLKIYVENPVYFTHVCYALKFQNHQA